MAGPAPVVGYSMRKSHSCHKKAKWLSGEALQIAVKRREVKSKPSKVIRRLRSPTALLPLLLQLLLLLLLLVVQGH